MLAIVAGVFLWCFVILGYAFGLELGTTASVLLLSLGAVLVASYAIQSVKLSATGFELKTRQTTTPIHLHIQLPRMNYVNIACYAVIFVFVFFGIATSLLPSLESICRNRTPYSHCDAFELFPDDASVRVRILFYWAMFFSAIALATLFIKWLKARALRNKDMQ